MKRSDVNKYIKDAIGFFQKHHYPLPPFAFWNLADWKKEEKNCREIIETRIGWDVTDAGLGDFHKIGRTIFTLRNGLIHSTDFPKSYAQKIMHLREGQKLPVHFHLTKMEDIINIAGGKVEIIFWNAGNNGIKSQTDVSLQIDGKLTVIKAGGTILLSPGQSVCVKPKTCHEFCAYPGSGETLSMEVSSVCDDLHDNIWLTKADRFPKIIEDEEPIHLLCSDYKKFL